MKELIAKKVYLEEYDINVNPYLTPTQVEDIAKAVINLNSWLEREQMICYKVLCYATDIGESKIEELDPDMIASSGLYSEVMLHIINFSDIYNAIKHYESPVRMLADIAQNMPELLEQLKGIDIKDVIENANV